jgi:hypothetical protein
VLGIEGDEVVFHVENANRESGVFAFDVPSRRLRKLEPPGTWALPGVRSPAGRHTAEATADGELWLHSVGDGSRRLADGLGVTFSVFASVAGVGPPVLWLDERTLLTQIDNGRLITVGLDGVVKPLVEIADVPAPVTRPRFERDGAGALVYVCESSWLIDVEGRRATARRWLDVGHGFELEVARDEKKGHRVRHRGTEIGRAWCSPWQAATAPGWVAVPFAEEGANLGYPKGVLVWNARTGAWTEIEGAVNSIVGWIRGR